MNKRTIILLIVAVAIVGVGAFLLLSKKTGPVASVSIFPGGSTTSTTGSISTTQGETTGQGTSTPPTNEQGVLPRLYQLHNNPVAGIGFAETKDKKGATISIKARYVERSLGNMFETDLTSYTENRIVNETRPHISEALWGNGGQSVVLRFVDDPTTNVISSRIVNLFTIANSTSTPSEFLQTEEIYLPDSIPFMATAEDGSNNTFYLKGNDGVLSNYKAVSESKIFNSVFTEWLPQFPNQKLVTLTTRPSANIPGHMFFVDTKTKAITKVLGDINGLTTLTSHDGKMVLYSETKNGKPELSLYDVTNRLSIPLYLQTLPEKCVWGNRSMNIAYCAVPQTVPSAIYPDQWYQGLISFNDNIWEVNASTFTARKVLSPGSLGAPGLDMIKLALSSNDTYLLFVNRNDEAPWVYSIVEPLPVTPASNLVSTSTSVAPSVVTSDMQKLK